MSVDVESLRQRFPALDQKVHGKALVYLDSAASALREKSVIDALIQYYSFDASNVHRGAHYLSDKATGQFEEARAGVARFINASSSNEVVFTRGTTESINLVASSLGKDFFQHGDEILLSVLEHHSNIVPWQMVAKEKGLKIRYIEIDQNGDLDRESFKASLNDKTKLMAITACSNAIGTVTPLKEMISEAKKFNVRVLVDAAQSISCIATDVEDLDCDYLAFSGHKVFGPNGIGVLYGKEELLNSMAPYQGGGSMISTVRDEDSDYLNSPQRFEAGTPNVAGAIGLSRALQFVSEIGCAKIREHEQELVKLATEGISKIDGVKIFSQSSQFAGIVSFGIDGIHHSDVGQLLDQYGIAVRAGHHCAQVLMGRMNVEGTVRASFSVYNNFDDVNRFVDSVAKVREFF